MTVYIALIRNIGPVSHASMPLGELAARCARAGLRDVVSIGNTGNLVFASEKPQAEAEAVVGREVRSFGLGNEVFSRTARQWLKLIELMPFRDAAQSHPSKLGVCFFHKDPRWPKAYLDYEGPERLALLGNHLVIDYRAEISVSRLTVEKTVGARMTQRNWNTVLAIAGKLSGG